MSETKAMIDEQEAKSGKQTVLALMIVGEDFPWEMSIVEAWEAPPGLYGEEVWDFRTEQKLSDLMIHPSPEFLGKIEHPFGWTSSENKLFHISREDADELIKSNARAALWNSMAGDRAKEHEKTYQEVMKLIPVAAHKARIQSSRNYQLNNATKERNDNPYTSWNSPESQKILNQYVTDKKERINLMMWLKTGGEYWLHR